MESISSAGSSNFEALPAASGASPRSGAASAPVAHFSYQREPPPHHRPLVYSPRISFLEQASSPSLSSISTSATYNNSNNINPGGGGRASPLVLPPQAVVQAQSLPSPRGMMSARRFLLRASNEEAKASNTDVTTTSPGANNHSGRSCIRAALAGGNILMNRHKSDDSNKDHRTLASNALAVNDAMVYLDGPRVYACQNCRTHLTSHDDIISKSFHGRHGRAYLFDDCVNVTIGPPEDRMLITGLHSVCDIFCKRCQKCVGWTYQKAYEASQKYKEGKFIIEKINLYLEDNSGFYDVEPPAGERQDKWRKRSISWGSEECSGGSGLAGPPLYNQHHHHYHHHSHSLDQPMSPGGRSAASSSSLIYEYRPSAEDASSTASAIPLSPSLPL